MIRAAQIHELKLLAPGAMEFWMEGKLPGKFVPEVFERNWTKLNGVGIGRIFISIENGIIHGAIGIILSRDINDDALVAEEAFWFVRPDYRRAGIRLFYHAEKYAIASKCERMCMVHLHSLSAEKLGAFYEKNGYSVIEHKYQKSF